MKRLAILLAACLCFPTLSKSVDATTVVLSNPGTDRKTSASITLAKGTAWEVGDPLTITFDVGESSKIDTPSPDCNYTPENNRRYNPGPALAQKCPDSPFIHMFSKMYSVKFTDKVELELSNDLPDTWIPGFLMPMLPGDIDKAGDKFKELVSMISINGIPCRPVKGTQFISIGNLRQITVIMPAQVEMMKEATIFIPEAFGLVCPFSEGSYEIKVESKVKGSAKIDVVKPAVSNPKLVITPEFPNENATWTFSFNLSKAGSLSMSSSFFLKVPTGFAKLQADNPGFQVKINGTSLPKGYIRMSQGKDYDQMLIASPMTFEAGTPMTIELSVINTGEGDVSCVLSTTSDIIPVTFGPQTIKFSQVATQTETTAGLATALTLRFKSLGNKAGDIVLVVLPSEINEKCEVSFNGKVIDRPTLGTKTAQFDLPIDIPEGTFCKIGFSNVTNPFEKSVAKISIINNTYEIPWNVSPYQTRMTVATYPNIGNRPAQYFFRITPPPDLLDVERKQVTINGSWNKIMRPNSGPVMVNVRGISETANFDSTKNSLIINLSEEFPNMKPLTVEIPIEAGFGTPDKTTDFTVTINGKTIVAPCNVIPGAPAVSYKISGTTDKELVETENGWFSEPVKLTIFTSSGSSSISLEGLDQTVTSDHKDLETIISQSMISENLKATVVDEGGTTQVTLPPIKIDLEDVLLKVTNPFEKTGVSPTQNLIIGVETNRKSIVKGNEFMIIEPEISVLINDIPEATIRLNSKIEASKAEAKFNTDVNVKLKYQVNKVTVKVTDETGRSKETSFSLKLDVKTVTLELDGSKSMAFEPGLGQVVTFVTEPETQVYIAESVFKADMSGKVKVKLDINPGYNIFFTQLITKENVSYEYVLTIMGKRVIKMKSEQKFIMVDGSKIDIKVPPTTITFTFKKGDGTNLKASYAYVPLRVLAENLFSTVTYDAATKTATIIQKQPDHNKKIQLTLDNPNAIVDGQYFVINKDYPITPVLKNGSVLIPLRFAAEQLGALVGFDNATKEITLSWPDEKKRTDTKPVTPGKKP